MKRLVLVYNPRSARFPEVERKVIQKSRELKGWMVCKFEVRKASVEENAEELAKIIKKDDLVVSAGGDGTASMVLNAILKSEKLATLGVLGLGNFNDYALTFGEMSLQRICKKFSEGKFEELYPLEVKVDGRFFRYVGMYFTVGMFAEAAGVFEKPKVRKRIGKVKNRLGYSIRKLAGWYFFWNKWRKDFFPEGRLLEGGVQKGFQFEKGTTDYVALNGKSVAGLVEAKGWTQEKKEFLSGTLRNRSFWRMLVVGVRTLEGKLPGKVTEGDVIEFLEPGDVYLHVEGELEKKVGVKRIEVKKTGVKLRVIRK